MNHASQVLFSEEHPHFVKDIYSDGSFVWLKNESRLILSSRLSECLEGEVNTLRGLIKEGFFSNLLNEDISGLHSAQQTFIDCNGCELTLTFRYKKSEDKSFLSGCVFVLRVVSPLNVLQPVYRRLFLKAASTSFTHDINNSLAMITSVVDWMKLKKINDLAENPENFEKKLNLIVKSVRSVQTELSKLESLGQLSEIVNEAPNLATALQKIIKIFKKKIEAEGLTVSCDLKLSNRKTVIPIFELYHSLFSVLSVVLTLALETQDKDVKIVSSEAESSYTMEMIVQGGVIQGVSKINLIECCSSIDLLLSEYSSGVVVTQNDKRTVFKLSLKTKVYAQNL